MRLRLNPLSGRLEIIQSTNQGGGGTGVTPPFVFSRLGIVGAGTYLFNPGNTISSSVGQLIPGLNNLVKIAISCKSVVAGVPAVMQMQRRTAVSTFIDIPDAVITIPVGEYNITEVTLPVVPFGPDWEVSWYCTSGQFEDPNLAMFLIPQ